MTRPLHRALAWLLRGAIALLLTVQAVASAQPAGAGRPVRFGVLPVGGPFESLTDWGPLVADLSRAIGRPVTVLPSPTYQALERAIANNEVDIAYLSGKLALDSVTRHGMNVVAQITRQGRSPGYRALLLTRKTGPLTTLQDLLADPGRWRIAHGESQSVSGSIVPRLELFLPRRIDMETRFLGETIGNHQTVALAVANGTADVATNNTEDFERFRRQFPVEAGGLQVIWTSSLIPHEQIVVRDTFDPELQKQVQAFFTGYGRDKGPRGEQERAALKSMYGIAGFVSADNRSLLPIARMTYQLAQQSALAAQWVNEGARQSRLVRIGKTYADQVAALGGDGQAE